MAEPILSVAEMRDREARTWGAGVSQEAVIRRAGAAVAEVVHRCTGPSDPILVLAGQGHNGSDAVAAEQHLADRDCELLRFSDPGAFAAAEEWLREHRNHPRAWVVDGLFGIGLNRPLEGEWRRLIDGVNESGRRVLAIDVPSGLNADTGEPQGAAMRATVTVTLGSVKAGLIREPAAAYVGHLELAHDIGLVGAESGGDQLWTLPGDFADFPRQRMDNAHKGAFGHVAILAGSLGYHGAAVLAAQGALRGRPGLVTVFTDERCYDPVASQLRAAMVRPWKGETLAEGDWTAWVLGPGLASPGLSPAVKVEVSRIWQTAPGAVVADASALDWLRTCPVSEGAGPRVITPHPGEAARLLHSAAKEIQGDRFTSLRRLAGLWPRVDLVVVLKGRHTLVGGASGPLFINSSGGPGLAQGGSGDVLAGYLGGLLAQPGLQQDVTWTARYGVWRHGAAGDALDARHSDWTTEDLVAELVCCPLIS